MTVRQKYLELHQAREQESHGAIALTFYNLFWIFFIVSIVGLFGETIVSFFRDGHWESRAGLVFGPFSPIKTVQQAFFAYFFNDEFMQTRFETVSMWTSLAMR